MTAPDHADLRAALTDPERGPVHNHPPYDPPCNERLVDGQLRGACLTDPEEPSCTP